MNKCLVMTSINPPTEAVKRFASMPDWTIVMVGDKKTPSGWACPGVTYLSPQDQENLPFAVLDHIPWNRPARANLGYLWCLQRGADLITQADDDNIPNMHWGIPAFRGVFRTLSYNGFINIYRYFTDAFVWPRGFPLDQILQTPEIEEDERPHRIGAWQHLADGDTDVDAIYRLTNNRLVQFKQRPPVVLAPNTACPFNCQSTTFHRDAAVLLYLPVRLTPRASDIVRGLVAQPILWQHGYTLGFTSPTVRQDRNPHDYLRDFCEEILIYLRAEAILLTTKSSLKAGAPMADLLIGAYRALLETNLVSEEEIPAVEAWVEDVTSLAD